MATVSPGRTRAGTMGDRSMGVECLRPRGTAVGPALRAGADPVPVSRGAEVVALAQLAAHGAQSGHLLAVLDPLGHCLQLKALTELDDRADEAGLGRAARHAVDEGLRDLDRVHG